MIVYIHGFASSGNSIKAQILKKMPFKDSIFAPSLSFIPELAISTLEDFILTCKEEVYLLGSSLGGFYALYLSQKYNLKAVLINPSIKPYETLASYQMMSTYFDNDCKFYWSEAQIASLKQYEVLDVKEPENLLVLLQTGDETLNYKVAQKRLHGAKIVIEEGGSHAFDNFETQYERIYQHFNT